MGRRSRGDRLMHGATAFLAAAPAVVALGLAGFLLAAALPAIRYMGWSFFSGTTWSLGNLYAQHAVVVHGVHVEPGAQFGACVFIVGTAVTAFLALVFATPPAVAAAAASALTLPPRWRRPAAAMVETLAGIPSVVYGLVGLMTLGPFVFGSLGPWLDRWLSPLPFISGAVNTPTNLLTAVLVLTVMILPIIAATVRAFMERIPSGLLEAGRALGWTDWEIFRLIVLPYAAPAVLGGMLLGLGRALGETMAVLMVSGNALNVLPSNWYSAVGTLAATIAGQLDAAFQDPTGMAVSALGLLGLLLMAMTLATNLLARVLVNRWGVRASAGVAR